MLKQRAQQFFIGALALLLALAAGVYLWVVRPQQTTALDEQRLAHLEQQVEVVAAEVARLERIEREVPTAGQQLNQFVEQHFLPEEKGFSVIVGEFERAAANVGVKPGRVDFRSYDVKERPELVRVEITTAVEGGYAGILRFLETLERSGNFYLLARLGLSETPARSGLRLDLTVETYLRRQQA